MKIFASGGLNVQLGRKIGRSLGIAIAFVCGLFLTAKLGFAAALPPIAAAHPIPAILTQAVQRLSPVEGDYFDQIERKSVGYLIWSDFPVKVAVNASGDERWRAQVNAAVAEWQRYFPLVMVENSETADIRIEPKRLALKPDAKTGKLPRFRSAQTHYDVFVEPATQRLGHRMTIELAPGQASDVMLSVARHEIGHAIGLWGHSPSSEDIMYFSQVKTPPLISSRDLQTLYRVYEQPTRLGWHLDK
jgi:predicted Zn-dependent protease